MCSLGGSQVAQWVKNSPAMQESRKEGLIPGLESSPGGGHGNPPPPHYSCLENPAERGAWRATIHRVAESGTRLKKLRMYPHLCFTTLSSKVNNRESNIWIMLQLTLKPHIIFKLRTTYFKYLTSFTFPLDKNIVVSLFIAYFCVYYP